MMRTAIALMIAGRGSPSIRNQPTRVSAETMHGDFTNAILFFRVISRVLFYLGTSDSGGFPRFNIVCALLYVLSAMSRILPFLIAHNDGRRLSKGQSSRTVILVVPYVPYIIRS